MTKMRMLAVFAWAGLLFVAAYAQTASMIAQPGAVIVEPPTIGALGVEWRIQGDDNRNAAVALAWRRTGELTWRDGLPLLRLNGEAVQQGASFHYVAPNMFAGSVFGLEPGTSYDLRLRLSDPDAPAGGQAVPGAGRRQPKRSEEGVCSVARGKARARCQAAVEHIAFRTSAVLRLGKAWKTDSPRSLGTQPVGDLERCDPRQARRAARWWRVHQPRLVARRALAGPRVNQGSARSTRCCRSSQPGTAAGWVGRTSERCSGTAGRCTRAAASAYRCRSRTSGRC